MRLIWTQQVLDWDECQSSQLLHPQLKGVILSVLWHQSQILHLKVESFAKMEEASLLSNVEKRFRYGIESTLLIVRKEGLDYQHPPMTLPAGLASDRVEGGWREVFAEVVRKLMELQLAERRM